MSADDEFPEIPDFPVSVCSDGAPHARHRIEGTWRTECPGVLDDAALLAPGVGPDIDDPEAVGGVETSPAPGALA